MPRILAGAVESVEGRGHAVSAVGPHGARALPNPGLRTRPVPWSTVRAFEGILRNDSAFCAAYGAAVPSSLNLVLSGQHAPPWTVHGGDGTVLGATGGDLAHVPTAAQHSEPPTAVPQHESAAGSASLHCPAQREGVYGDIQAYGGSVPAALHSLADAADELHHNQTKAMRSQVEMLRKVCELAHAEMSNAGVGWAAVIDGALPESLRAVAVQVCPPSRACPGFCPPAPTRCASLCPDRRSVMLEPPALSSAGRSHSMAHGGSGYRPQPSLPCFSRITTTSTALSSDLEAAPGCSSVGERSPRCPCRQWLPTSSVSICHSLRASASGCHRAPRRAAARRTAW
eukprot:SAG11_NODE_2589_length_3188_cov_2.228155_1_plen_342_part_00